MAIYFFDTNALVRRYLPGPGSEWIGQALKPQRPAHVLFISELTRVEMRSSLYKLERIFQYHSAFTDAAIQRFERHLSLVASTPKDTAYRIVALGPDVLLRASVLLRAYRSGKPHAIRTLDAIQLACALIARDSLPPQEREHLLFVTSDKQLIGVATHEGLTVLRPEDQPVW
ncbi:MAG TPA: type II toxin-antitoxin system VapC family toxin [Ktedonobacterales bacterium]|nr:type II toxin-antitoxin system VapC family toxin [Ktedonobacterales bacterium]